jgi:hypothetical protein
MGREGIGHGLPDGAVEPLGLKDSSEWLEILAAKNHDVARRQGCDSRIEQSS